MKLDRFIELLASPSKLDKKSLAELHELIMQYPYFQSARILWNHNLKCTQHADTYKHLQTTAAYAGDRSKLVDLFYVVPKKQETPTDDSNTSTDKKTIDKHKPSDNNTRTTNKTDNTQAKQQAKQQNENNSDSDSVQQKEKTDNNSTTKEKTDNTTTKQKPNNETKKTDDKEQTINSTTANEKTEKKTNKTKKTKPAKHNEIYYAADIDNISNYFKREGQQHTTILEMSIKPTSSDEKMNDDELESFIRNEANKILVAKENDTPAEEITDELLSENQDETSELLDHDAIIDGLIGNLRKAREKAIADDDDDEIERLLGGRPRFQKRQEDYQEVLDASNTDKKELTKQVAAEQTTISENTTTDTHITKEPVAENTTTTSPATDEQAIVTDKNSGQIEWDMPTNSPEEVLTAEEVKAIIAEDDSPIVEIELLADKQKETTNKQAQDIPANIDEQTPPQEQIKPQATENKPEAESNDTDQTKPETTPPKEKIIDPNETAADRALRKVAEIRAKRQKQKQDDANTSKTEKKNPENKQSSNLIDQFIETTPSMNRPSLTDTKLEDISTTSIQENEGLVSETLANMYLSQKHYHKAISILEQLSLKYPEKNAYFADRIMEINNIVNPK